MLFLPMLFSLIVFLPLLLVAKFLYVVFILIGSCFLYLLAYLGAITSTGCVILAVYVDDMIIDRSRLSGHQLHTVKSKKNSKLTNLKKISRIEGYNGKYGSNPPGIREISMSSSNLIKSNDESMIEIGGKCRL